MTRSWSTTSSRAQGTNWSDATSLQRVYEYTVEPRTLQDLPDYAMLLVESSAGGPVLRAVECNPDIITLPRMSMDPLPDLGPPHPQPTAAIPTQPPGQPWPAAPLPGATTGFALPQQPTPPGQTPAAPPWGGWPPPGR